MRKFTFAKFQTSLVQDISTCIENSLTIGHTVCRPDEAAHSDLCCFQIQCFFFIGILTLLHSEWPNFWGFGHSECKGLSDNFKYEQSTRDACGVKIFTVKVAFFFITGHYPVMVIKCL